MKSADEVFQFFALTGTGRGREINRIGLGRELQEELTEQFLEQARHFVTDDTELIDFDANFRPGAEHLFRIDQFELPAEFLAAAEHPTQHDPLSLRMPRTIKAIFAAHYDPRTSTTRLYIQSFRASRRLESKKNLFQSGNNFHRLNENGITLDSKLVGIFDGSSLLFRSHAAMNSIIDISDHYREATDVEISDVLSSSVLSVDDPDWIMEVADKTMRKRFSLVLQSGILDKVSAQKVQSRAKKFDLKLKTVTQPSGKRAVCFPTDKATVKEFLKFLNDCTF